MAEIKEGAIGRHKKTGEQLIRRNGEWVPLESAPIQADSPAAAAMTHTVASQPSTDARGPTPFTIDRDTGAMRPLTGIEKFRYGFGLGARNIGLNLAEMVGMTSPERVREAQAEGAPITEQFPGNVGAFTGETAALLPVGMGVGGMATRLGMAPRGVLAGVTEGGVQGAVAAGPDDPSTERSERLIGLGMGTLTGGALPSAKRMAQMLASGRDMTRSARKLTSRGVDLTPGQMQPESTYGQIEEAMMAIPALGPRIKAARERGWTQTQNLIAQEAAPPGFTMQPRKDPQAMFRDLIDAYDKAYEVGKGYGAIPVIRPDTGPDISLYQAMKPKKTSIASDDAVKIVNKIIDEEYSVIRKKGTDLKSDDLLALRSRIRQKIRELQSNEKAPYGAEDLLKNSERQITAALDSQLPENVLKAVRAIDAKYGNFIVIQNALTQTSKEGFTPYNFAQAVRESAPSDRAYAAGGGRMRDIAAAGREVFENRQPQTGRMALTVAPVLGAGGGAAALGGLPGALGAAAFTGAAVLPYLRNAAGDVARDVLIGRTSPQVALRNAQRKARRTFTPQERETVARLLATQGIVLGATPEEQE